MLLYYLTDARSESERNIAGKYTLIVDFMHEQGVEDDEAAEYIQKAGGVEELLKKARKGQALKAADETMQSDDQDFEREDEFEEAAFSSTSTADEIFDPEKDLAIRLKPEALAKVLGSEVPTNELFYLECRKTGSVGDGGF